MFSVLYPTLSTVFLFPLLLYCIMFIGLLLFLRQFLCHQQWHKIVFCLGVDLMQLCDYRGQLGWGKVHLSRLIWEMLILNSSSGNNYYKMKNASLKDLYNLNIFHFCYYVTNCCLLFTIHHYVYIIHYSCYNYIHKTKCTVLISHKGWGFHLVFLPCFTLRLTVDLQGQSQMWE